MGAALAERTGLIVGLGRWVLRDSLRPVHGVKLDGSFSQTAPDARVSVAA
ncbi:hypothetical protein [Actinoplanes solisilvae]|nr:hypothetical protein [Actinoplanes solisilvae]